MLTAELVIDYSVLYVTLCALPWVIRPCCWIVESRGHLGTGHTWNSTGRDRRVRLCTPGCLSPPGDLEVLGTPDFLIHVNTALGPSSDPRRHQGSILSILGKPEAPGFRCRVSLSTAEQVNVPSLRRSVRQDVLGVAATHPAGPGPRHMLQGGPPSAPSSLLCCD